MDVVIQRAEQLGRNYLRNLGSTRNREALEKFLIESESFYDPLDRIRFFSRILELNKEQYERHLQHCKQDPNECGHSIKQNEITFFINQELRQLGAGIDADSFTPDEKHAAESKIDKVLADLTELKLGHEIIYNQIQEELAELRNLFFLGKKKWNQLFIGKAADMVASGVVGEAVAKPLFDLVKRGGVLFLNG